jgi:hypothetical protein
MIVQHNQLLLFCPTPHHKKTRPPLVRPRQMCQFRTFSCVSAVYKSYSGTALPQEQVPASTPSTPREVGTTLIPIVAFPCVRWDYLGDYCALLQVRHSCHQVAVEPML